MDKESLNLEEVKQEARREKKVEAIMEAVPCKDDEGRNKSMSEMDVEALPLEENTNKKNSGKNVDAV